MSESAIGEGPPTKTPPIRILIVDDHDVFGASLAFTLNNEPDMRTVGVAGSARAALTMAAASAPDVILLDRRLPDGDGISLIQPLLGIRSAVQIVILTASTSDHVLLAAIEAGACGFIDKSQSLADVVAAIRTAAAGESLVSPRMLARLLPRLRKQASGITSELTDRERGVLGYLSEGLSNAEIAARMTVSVHTVRNHVANLSAKLGAHSKLEALTIAIRQGLVSG